MIFPFFGVQRSWKKKTRGKGKGGIGAKEKAKGRIGAKGKGKGRFGAKEKGKVRLHYL